MISADDIFNMVKHWLHTPPNGYLGSGYGSDPHSLLQQPNSSGLADSFIDKMFEDLPALKTLPRGSVNVYFEQASKERKILHIQVANVTVPFEG